MRRGPLPLSAHVARRAGGPKLNKVVLSSSILLKMSKNDLPRVQGIQVAVPHNTVAHTTPHNNTVSRNKN